MLERLKARADALKNETYSVYLAARDPRTPWTARALVLLVVAYALSPIDLIPDFIPVLGYLDDLIIIPAGIALSLKLIPAEVMEDARQTAGTHPPGRALKAVGTILIVAVWIIAIIGLLWFIRPFVAARTQS
jgi:uncharacterized membrane protein YkvA (DUF1232 family)